MSGGLTFLHVWATANEATSIRVRRHAARVMQRLGPAKSTSTDGRILVHQMGVLGATTLSKVFDLHDLRENRNIHGRFRGFREIVSLQDIRILQTYTHR